MAKRRPSGDGMVRRRDDDRWEGRIVVGHKKDGSPIFRHILAPTQKELLDKLHQNIQLYQDVELTEDCRMTLAVWLDRWLEEYVAGTVRESTLSSHKNNVELYIKPQLGDKKISAITAEDVQKMYTKLKKPGRVREHPKYDHQLSDAMICHIHCTLHRALDDAVAAHLIPRNPTEGAVVPKPNYKSKQILTKAQFPMDVPISKKRGLTLGSSLLPETTADHFETRSVQTGSIGCSGKTRFCVVSYRKISGSEASLKQGIAIFWSVGTTPFHNPVVAFRRKAVYRYDKKTVSPGKIEGLCCDL